MKNTTQKTQKAPVGSIIFTIVIVACLCVYLGGKRDNGAQGAEKSTDVVKAAPTLNDTLAKSEIRAVVFLKLQYGAKREDIELAAQAWYPEQKMEVCKWRIRNGMEHMMVVTQTRLKGNDINSYDAYNTWDVKVVNKYSE